MFPTPKGEAFFLSSGGCRLSAGGLQANFAKARKLAGLDEGKRLRPHDLRHRFAGLWHQQRADVQALLPLLATYFGHASYIDTAYYLTGSSDLLAIAAERAFPFCFFWLEPATRVSEATGVNANDLQLSEAVRRCFFTARGVETASFPSLRIWCDR